jgi:hypothetical protein
MTIDTYDPKRNPFFAGRNGDINTFWFDATSRIHRVKTFTIKECRAALEVEDLQKTVQIAIERRIRRLKAEG